LDRGGSPVGGSRLQAREVAGSDSRLGAGWEVTTHSDEALAREKHMASHRPLPAHEHYHCDREVIILAAQRLGDVRVRVRARVRVRVRGRGRV